MWSENRVITKFIPDICDLDSVLNIGAVAFAEIRAGLLYNLSMGFLLP